jgi:hypothetical protein
MRCYTLVWYIGLTILLGVMPDRALFPERAAQHSQADAKAVELAFLTLVRAPRLTSMYLGFGRERSLEGAAWRVLVVQPTAKSKFRSLTQQANPVGRLYGLIGLKQVDPRLFETEAARFDDWTDPIEVQQGGVIRTQAFKEVLADIRAGLWVRDMFLTSGLH